VLASIDALKPRPAAIVVSGDLVDRGEAEEYEALLEIFREVDIPTYFGVGNHDRRAPFLAALEGNGAERDANGFVQYAVDLGAMRLVVCDTLDETQDSAAFCSDRADWLAATLDAEPEKPTIIALHHPPIVSGVQWMDPSPSDPWIGRLANAIRGRSQVRVVVCGHVHRTFHGILAGQLIAATSASSIQLTLDLSPVDLHQADGRELLVEEPPGYALIMADGTVHACVAGDFAAAVNYTVPFQKA